MNFDKRIDKEIEMALKPLRKYKFMISLVDQFLLSCKGGKKIRAMLVSLGFEIATGKISPNIFKPAAAVEIFHTAILAHDDIIDQSELRRGKPSLYKSLDIPQAMVLGDLGFFLANKLIAESNFPDKQKNRALTVFNQMMINTGIGELLDIEPKLQEQEQIILVSFLKTACYTFVGPLSLGAILGNANDKILKAIEKMGKNLGIGYQIQDDILGSFGPSSQTGKSAISDIAEGKKTLLWWYAVENGGKNERQTLARYYGKGRVSKEQLDQVRDVFVKTGAVDYCKGKVVDYMILARKIIPQISQNKKIIKILEKLVDDLKERTK